MMTDAEIIAVAKATETAEPGTDGYILPVSFARAIIAAQKGCACRWDADGKRVATCQVHQGWLDVLGEGADRAKDAESIAQSRLLRIAELENECKAWALTVDNLEAKQCRKPNALQRRPEPKPASPSDMKIYQAIADNYHAGVAAAGASPAQPSESAEHWHSLYIKKCQELHDEKARLGAEIETLELAAIDDAERYAVPPSQALSLDLLERLSKTLTRLGYATPEGGMEHFNADLANQLYSLCRAVDSLFDREQPPAPSDTAITYMTGYGDGREWAQTSQAVVVEPVYQYQLANGNWIDQTKESYDYNVKHGQATVRMLYATPQAAPLYAKEQQ